MSIHTPGSETFIDPNISPIAMLPASIKGVLENNTTFPIIDLESDDEGDNRINLYDSLRRSSTQLVGVCKELTGSNSDDAPQLSNRSIDLVRNKLKIVLNYMKAEDSLYIVLWMIDEEGNNDNFSISIIKDSIYFGDTPAISLEEGRPSSMESIQISFTNVAYVLEAIKNTPEYKKLKKNKLGEAVVAGTTDIQEAA